MKKNYVKPSLLSETFVTENIMDSTSAANLWSISGDHFEGIKFNFKEGGNTIYSIKFSDFNPQP